MLRLGGRAVGSISINGCVTADLSATAARAFKDLGIKLETVPLVSHSLCHGLSTASMRCSALLTNYFYPLSTLPIKTTGSYFNEFYYLLQEGCGNV